MKLLSALVALLPLATAFPRLNPRQSSEVQIADVTAAGPGCPPNAVRKSVSNSSTDATFGFDAYQSALGDNIDGVERDKHCQIFFTLRFPVGCTAATVATTHRGFATLAEGTTGVVIPSYKVSPGELESDEQVPDFFEGPEYVEGSSFERVDEVVAKVDVSGEEDRDVQFVVQSRTFVQTTGEPGEGTVTADDISVAVKGLEAC